MSCPALLVSSTPCQHFHPCTASRIQPSLGPSTPGMGRKRADHLCIACMMSILPEECLPQSFTYSLTWKEAESISLSLIPPIGVTHTHVSSLRAGVFLLCSLLYPQGLQNNAGTEQALNTSITSNSMKAGRSAHSPDLPLERGLVLM